MFELRERERERERDELFRRWKEVNKPRIIVETIIESKRGYVVELERIIF